MRLFISIIILLFSYYQIKAQGCCSGGAGNPIAGGTSTGVLLKNQIEISFNYQHNFSDKFFYGKTDTSLTSFDNLNSNYLFLRTDYGLNKNLTLSIASGYFLNKSKVGYNLSDTINSKGLSDLIFFPRYNIYNKDLPFTRSEITLGLGVKIPIGSHTDSSQTIPGVWDVNPPISQLSSGANDIILYSFFYREYKLKRFRVFANILHINKGYNSLDQKIGDYTSYAIYFGKSFKNKVTLTTQVKAEFIEKMDAGESPLSWENDYLQDLEESSGSKKIFFIPQISFPINSFSFFATYELPIYQNINGIQIGSKNQFTLGLNYRFLTKKNEISEKNIMP
jgi:hypothetical protein